MGGRTALDGVATLAANQQALTDAVHEAGDAADRVIVRSPDVLARRTGESDRPAL